MWYLQLFFLAKAKVLPNITVLDIIIQLGSSIKKTKNNKKNFEKNNNSVVHRVDFIRKQPFVTINFLLACLLAFAQLLTSRI